MLCIISKRAKKEANSENVNLSCFVPSVLTAEREQNKIVNMCVCHDDDADDDVVYIHLEFTFCAVYLLACRHITRINKIV